MGKFFNLTKGSSEWKRLGNTDKEGVMFTFVRLEPLKVLQWSNQFGKSGERCGLVGSVSARRSEDPGFESPPGYLFFQLKKKAICWHRSACSCGKMSRGTHVFCLGGIGSNSMWPYVAKNTEHEQRFRWAKTIKWSTPVVERRVNRSSYITMYY